MKKKIFVLALLVFALSLTTGCFNQQASSPQQNTQQEQTQNAPVSSDDQAAQTNEPKEESFLGSLKDLMNSGVAKKCTWTSGNSKNINGTLWISGKKFSQEVNITDDSVNAEDKLKNYQMSMISDGTWAYTWNTIMPGKGNKMNLAELEKTAPKDTANSDKVDLEKKTDYKCLPWVVDEAKFALPADITFTDTTEDIKDMQSGATTTNTSACDICDRLPDAGAKATCKKSLKCE
jgi:hypothetical protein